VRVVFDTSVVVAGGGWRGDSHLCLVALARRRIQAYASAWILEEIRRTVTHLQAENTFKRHDPWPLIHWFCDAARPVAPAPLGKQRSRDPGDDPFLAAALAAEAAVIVSLDGDLLALGKPFGVEVITPRQLLSRLQRFR
jgi:putative PIN family toxin of toxin-antitoxin system